MTALQRGRIMLAAGASLACAAFVVARPEPADEPVPPAKRAVQPIAPVLPGDVVSALQAGRFEDALTAIDRWKADPKTKPTADDKAYDALIRGIALRLAGKNDDARKTLATALEAAKGNTWAAKLRAELATTELSAGRFAHANALAREQAELLLSDARKDRLAGIYEAFAQQLLEPRDPTAKPDPTAAYELLAQAHDLAKNARARSQIRFKMGAAAQLANNHKLAIGVFELYLKEHPRGSANHEVRYRLGQLQLALGMAADARATWTHLARDLEKVDEIPATEILAKALYGIAQTYAVPRPSDDTALSLGVAALKRLIARFPASPLVVQASYDIGASYQSRNQSEAALETFMTLIGREAAPGEKPAERDQRIALQMQSQFQVAKILQGQEKLDESVAAFKGYLAKYPNGPQGAEAQRQILDTPLKIAEMHAKHERFEQARTAFNAFLAENPLDPRLPEVMQKIAMTFVAEKKLDDAITALERTVGKFPDSKEAAEIEVMIAELLIEKGDAASAIERLKKIKNDPGRGLAAQMIAEMQTKELLVVTPRAFRSGEVAHLKVGTRNIEKLTFSAYKLDPEGYFRKKLGLNEVEKLDVGLVAPDSEWTATVPEYGQYKTIEHEYPLEELKLPGAYVVKVTDEKSLQATTLVMGNDLDAIVKTSQSQALVFAQDMKTGKGRAGARVLVSEGSQILLEGKTGEDGVLLKNWDKPRSPKSALKYLVLDGPEAAGTGLEISERVAQGLTARTYLYTDRPAYRPGQTVQLRGVVREVVEGQYAAPAHARYQLEVTDSRGRRLIRRDVTLSEFGTFQLDLALDASAPVGDYRVRLFQPGKSDFTGGFAVQAYQLRKIDLAVQPARTVYFRGETVKAEVIARSQYGQPLAQREVVVHLPDGQNVRGRTDRDGKFAVEFPTDGFAEEQTLRIVAELPQDGVAAQANVGLALLAFRIDLHTQRDVYLDGEGFPLRITTLDAQGEPTAQTLSVAVLKRTTKAGQVTEREVSRSEAKTDGKTGLATVPIRVVDEDGGEYRIRVAGTDQFGNSVTTGRVLTISGKKDETRLRLLSDRVQYKVGETAEVRLHSRTSAGTALLAWEADRILKYQILSLREGDNVLSWDVDSSQFPNFTLAAARMHKAELDEASLNLEVERDLRITIAPTKPKVGPGEEIEVEVSAADQLGRPVAAEFSLALVDRALLRQFADKLPPIGRFFHNQERTGAFTTAASNRFSYSAKTEPVPGAIVDEQERAAQVAADEAKKRLGDAFTYSFMVRDLKSIDVPINGEVASAMLAKAKANVDLKTAEVSRLRRMEKMGAFTSVSEIEKAEAELAEARAVEQSLGGQTGIDLGAKVAELARRKQLAAKAAMGREGFEEIQALEKEITAGQRQQLTTRGSERRIRRYDSSGDSFDSTRLSREPVVVGLSRPGDPNYFARTRGELSSGPESPPREQFVETAYWNPSVVTGRDGKARVTFRAPMALSEYRFTARGVTGSDTLAGQATADLAVRKDFFVDLKAPSMLTQGDKPRFAAAVHHSGVSGTLNVKLVAYAGGRQMTYPKTVEIKNDGIEEILFDPFDVPDAENVRLAVSANVGNTSDEMVVEVPVRPWGVQAFASASGASSNDATAFVGLPAGRTYESPEMLIVVSPSTRRMLIELALGQNSYPLARRVITCILPPEANTVADRASDLLAATSALQYLRATKAPAAPEAGRLVDRIQGLVSELVTLQNDDGGWPWVAGEAGKPRPSDRMTSARALWALASAQPLGLSADTPILDKATKHLAQEFAKVDAGDHDTRAALLHALGTLKKATFEQANALNRERQNLSDVALAFLALTLADLDRVSLANEVLGVLVPRSKSESQTPGLKPRRYWEGQGRNPILRGPVEATALVSLAIARVRPQDDALTGGIEWLQAHRMGTGWQPHKSSGPALAALAVYYAQAQTAEDRYRLIVTVNDEEVYKADIAGSPEGKAISVPRKALKAGDANRVRFDIEGRGHYGYAVTMTGFTREFGPDQDRANKPFVLGRRVYFPAEPEYHGRTLPTGFGVAVNPKPFENTVTQVAVGGRARVHIDAYRNDPAGRPAWEREFLVLEEHLPAGTTLVEGSVESQASQFELADGVLRLYFAPDQYPGNVRYDVYGYLPGQYRALPPEVRSAYEPGRRHLGPTGDLRVLAPGDRSSDPYTPTPDELYARGKALYDAGQLGQAAEPLEALWGGYTLRDDIAKDAARMLLYVHIKDYNPRKVVQYFEILKEKAPDLVIPFDDIRVVGRAYGDIGEHERAYLVWRAVGEASYLEDARLGDALRQRGQTLEGIAMLLDLWREHPTSASIDSDFFGVSQLLAGLAGKATAEPSLRRALAIAGVTKSDLLAQAIRLTQVFLCQSPKNPLADEASLALVGNFLELEDYDSVVKLSARYAKLYSKSTLFDSFQYSEALGQFYLGKYDRAIELAESIAKATYKDTSGVDQPSPNKWQALYMLGQIHDARRQPAQAVSYYEKVAEQFSDAADAARSFTRKGLSLPEVAVLRPSSAPKVAAVGGVSALTTALHNLPSGPAPDEPKPEYPDRLELNYRNITDVDVKVYPVDLMRLYLTRRNLDGITGIDLAGITPLLQKTVKLGDGADFQDKLKALDLPLEKEGAYLVMVRGENLYASGIVLVSPLKLEVTEEPAAGRVRVTVRDARTGELRPKVQVKVIGSDNPSFFSGDTDLRGVFVAEGLRGSVTAVARKGTGQYAFHRGKTHVGTSPPATGRPETNGKPAGGKTKAFGGEPTQTLEGNLRQLNSQNRARQVDRLQQRYENKPSAPQGVQVDKAR
jgi:uncharacterized protein YfaS (alpha-2-macroglobulin family)